ncbi:protein FYV10 [Annulohypoxylon truncatum]|uniref:protein FYV10 n=1 Tax=Annulohypoxylon truncatum TaxID=327061 RepID=UPI0020075C98|nr:protein FYV10 [Annulohypoxylon truncatum]KAI1213486.1 protein FYV10 [Annulohypoxylon truncatum]
MGDVEAKLDHENHLLLDQPLLRLPVELLRKNFRSAHFEVEKDGTYLKNTLRETATGAVNGRAQQADVLRSLDAMIARARGTKRKLTAFAEEEARLHRHEHARVAHLSALYSMYSVDDVKYEAWSRVRLDRLIVDYLLRHGYNESARALAQEKGVEPLVDLETFEQMSRIRKCILNRSVTEALAWCTAGDTKKELRKMDSNLEFMLRFQQYIELVRDRSTKPTEILTYARKFLFPYRDVYKKEVLQACGMLALPPGSAQDIDAYANLYSPGRWEMLANLFTSTHNALLSLPSVPLLHIALQSGLSALKTPACHSSHPASAAAPSHSTSLSLATSVCPICSTELNELARSVPYALHSKSNVEPDLLMLPNGRAYGKARLEEYARKAGCLDGQVKDLRTGEIFSFDRLKKVFIT